MGFLSVLLLGGGTLLAFSAYRGLSPVEVLRAILRGEALPGPRYTIESQGLTGVGRAVGDIGAEGVQAGARAIAGLARPLTSWTVVSPYGMRAGRMHEGVDLAATLGTPIRAAAAGEVYAAGWATGAGNRVDIRHSSGLVTKYFHMSRIAVSKGQRVAQGQVIGYVGSTGRSSGPHLHFEVWVNGKSTNPLGYV